MKRHFITFIVLISCLNIFAQGQNITLANLKKIADTERVSSITAFVKQFGYKICETKNNDSSLNLTWRHVSNSDYVILLYRNSINGKSWVSWYTPSGVVFERFKKDILAAGYSHDVDTCDGCIKSYYKKRGSNSMIILTEVPIDLDEGLAQNFIVEYLNIE